MLKALKVLLAVTLALLISGAVYTTSYFFIEIRPHLEELKEEMKLYDVSTPNAQKLKHAFHLVGGGHAIKLIQHRTATRFISPKDHFRGYWHLVGLHWHLWVPILFDEDEIYALRLARIYYRDGYGIKGASRHYFDTDFSNLSCRQIVELALLDKSTFLGALGSEQQQRYIKEHNLFSMCPS